MISILKSFFPLNSNIANLNGLIDSVSVQVVIKRRLRFLFKFVMQQSWTISDYFRYITENFFFEK